jgi:signal transduction histidine kinase
MTRSLGSIWTRTIVGIVAAAALVFAFVLWITLGPLVQRWQQETGARIHDGYGEALHRLVAITGELNRRDVQDLLEPEAEVGALAVVWDADGYPLYWSRDGETHALLPPSLPEDARQPQLHLLAETLGRTRVDGVRIDAFPTGDSREIPPGAAPDHLATRLFAAYRDAGVLHSITSHDTGDEPLGYFVAGATSYGPDSPTGGVIRALLAALMAAVAVTAAVAGLLIARASSRVRAAMAAVLARLTRLAEDDQTGPIEGDRDSPLPSTAPGVREFDLVATQITAIDAQLQRERSLRRRWAQDIAHDLRTPIAGMRAQLEGMLDGVLDRGDERIERLTGSLGRLEALAQSFLLLTKIESPDYPLRREPVEIAAVLHEIVADHGDRASAAARPLEVSVAPEVPGVIAADGDLIVRAMHNLLDNALVHGEPGPVRVVAEMAREGGSGEPSAGDQSAGDRSEPAQERDTPPPHGGGAGDATVVVPAATAAPTTLRISVTNAGTLDPAIADNPFDRFARGGDGGRRGGGAYSVDGRGGGGGHSGGGHGLGLSVVEAVARLHGGRTWAFQRGDGGAGETVTVGFSVVV